MVGSKSLTLDKVPTIYECDSNGRGNHTVVADMDGTLLVSRSSLPYYARVAFDVGGIIRLFVLLAATPFAGLFYYFVSEAIAIELMVFITFVGVKVSTIKSAAGRILPQHYSKDLHPETWRVFSSCGKKYVLTANPRVMVEPFLKNNLGVDMVLGTEILSYKGIATGLVAAPGVLVGKNKADALTGSFGPELIPDVGIGDRNTDLPFMKLCKEMYIVPSKPKVKPLKYDLLLKPNIFHNEQVAD